MRAANQNFTIRPDFNYQSYEPEAHNLIDTTETENVCKFLSHGDGWQQQAYNQQKNNQFTITRAPCGAGKTTLLVALGIHDIVSSNFNQKVLIVTPQRNIADNFVFGHNDLECIKLNVDGTEYDWKILPKHNFVRSKNRLKEWLLAPAEQLKTTHHKNLNDNIISGLNAIATHALLCQVWNGLSEEERKTATQNLVLIIDEAHHINNVTLDECDLNYQNILSGIVNFIILNSLSAKIRLATATFYRGDQDPVVVDLDKFDIYTRYWHEHLPTLGLENVIIEFEEFAPGGTPNDRIIANVKNDPYQDACHLYCLPPKGGKYRKNHPNAHTNLISSLTEYKGNEVIDLMNQKTQNRNMERLRHEPKNSPEKIQIRHVVTCKMALEGTDWVSCARIHYAKYPNGSMTEYMQTIGRAMRRFPGKREVRIINYLERLPEIDGTTSREQFSHCFNLIMACLELDDEFNPVILYRSNSSGVAGGQRYYLWDALNVPREEALENLVFEYENLENKTRDNVLEMCRNLAERYSLYPELIGQIEIRFLEKLCKLFNNQNGKPVTDIKILLDEHGVDHIMEKSAVGRSLFFEGKMTPDKLLAIRNLLSDRLVKPVPKKPVSPDTERAVRSILRWHHEQ